MTQNYINHIALVLDASGSMNRRRHDVVKVADQQIAYLAQRSKELDQETRITVYTFNSTVQCVIYDKDVLRLPSIEQFYQPRGNTALIDATMQSQSELEETPQRYGDHAFLSFVLTDGEENMNVGRKAELNKKLTNLAENVTVAVLVPDQRAKFVSMSYGFPKDNIAIWDTTSVRGVEEVGEVIRRSTDTFMTGRVTGIRSYSNIFNTGDAAVNKETVKKAKLRALANGTYTVLKVTKEYPIQQFVMEAGHQYLIGKAFYQLTKTEEVQPQKQVALRNKKTGRFYTGPQARELLGLIDTHVRVKPDHNSEYDIFIQSTSVSRKLVRGTKLLLLK